jgi:hypothetical protein
MARVREIKLLATTSLVGDGTLPIQGEGGNPYRHQYELWTHDGELVCRCDPFDTDGSEGVVIHRIMDDLCLRGMA